ncbi:uncharacterized protein LOC117178933 [Belonocnema kinseyi]|uniref:uncharacterized protein LOC117178933 n=1 Tax=Belonocnema kinseyi TaxID=2817044 RepID=UPI00143DD8FC|nr:uncharacterized protein LOC117178933 [Belonocnema kinseyi]
MFKVFVFITLCVAVLAHKGERSRKPEPSGPPTDEGQESLVDSPHLRVARQMPSMPGDMNPAQFPSMMTDMAKQGFDAAAKAMDPNTWMGEMNQMTKMIPQTGK